MSRLVLLVEDDDDIRETLAAILGARGFHVVAAPEGRSALQQIRTLGSRPAVILLDLQMPVMDGETFLQEQQTDPLLAHVPVVVITAQLMLPPAFPPNVRAVYTKPIALAEILAAVQSACDAGRTVPTATAAERPGSEPGTE